MQPARLPVLLIGSPRPLKYSDRTAVVFAVTLIRRGSRIGSAALVLEVGLLRRSSFSLAGAYCGGALAGHATDNSKEEESEGSTKI